MVYNFSISKGGCLLMYKLIACDLDETLIKPDRTIDSRDIEAIKKLKDFGV